MSDGNSAVYKQKNISSGQPTVITGNPPQPQNVTNAGSEFYSGERRLKGQR